MELIRRQLDRTATRRFLAIGCITTIGLLLRFLGINFGLPLQFDHPDEYALVEHAAAMMRTGNLNPGWFHYPTGQIYVNLIAQIGYVFYAASKGALSGLPSTTLWQFYLVGRVLSALMGVAIIPMVYWIALRVVSRRAAAIAALLMATQYLAVVHSHYATTDMPSVFWCSLALCLAVGGHKAGKSGLLALCGLAIGIASGTKYQAGIIPLTYVFWAVLSDSFKDRRVESLSRILIGVAVGFFVSTPYALLDLPKFVDGVAFDLYHYAIGHPGYTTSNPLWFLASFLESADAVSTIFAIFGFVILLRRKSAYARGVAIAAFVFFALLSRSSVAFERNALPVVPLLMVAASAGIDAIAAWLSKNKPVFRRLRQSVVVALVASAIGLPVFADLWLFGTGIKQDPRVIATSWIADNTASITTLLKEHYTVTLQRPGLAEIDVINAADTPHAWYEAQPNALVIVGNGVWRQFLTEPQRYLAEIDWLKMARARWELKQEITVAVPRIVTSGYRSVADYHFPTMWIFSPNRATR